MAKFYECFIRSRKVFDGNIIPENNTQIRRCRSVIQSKITCYYETSTLYGCYNTKDKQAEIKSRFIIIYLSFPSFLHYLGTGRVNLSCRSRDRSLIQLFYAGILNIYFLWLLISSEFYKLCFWFFIVFIVTFAIY